MANSYGDILQTVRQAFSNPLPDTASDDLLIAQMTRALRGATAKKTTQPVLGKRVELDYSAAQGATLADNGISVEDATAELIARCEGLINPAHPDTQRNVVPPTTTTALTAVTLASLYNANIGWDEYSQRIALAEVELTAMLSQMIGYDPNTSGGLSTFGGLATSLYGVRIGLEKALPNTTRRGLREQAVLVTSDTSHYGRISISSWLGIGADNVVLIPTTDDNAIHIDTLRQRLRELLQRGVKIAAIVATMGTTDAFGLDDIAAIVALRDELIAEFELPYRIHVHADAVAGWAWSVFNDYDFTANPLAFSTKLNTALQKIRTNIQHLHLADSIGIDFHKSGFAPYISSIVLFKDKKDLQLLSRQQEQMSYLFQFGKYRPGMQTLEGSRAGSGVLSGLINLKLFGKQGLRVIVAHLTAMALLLRQRLKELGCIVILNPHNFGFVTLFRVYPDTVKIDWNSEYYDQTRSSELLAVNDYNRRIFSYLYENGDEALLSPVDSYRQTDYGEPILALKSYIMSPFTDATTIAATVDKIAKARTNVPAEAPEDIACQITAR